MNILRPKLLITNYQINFIAQFDNELKNKHNYKYILFYHFMPHHLNVLHLKIKYFIHIFYLFTLTSFYCYKTFYLSN